MADDKFQAFINGVEVLKGEDWNMIESVTIDITDPKYKIKSFKLNYVIMVSE